MYQLQVRTVNKIQINTDGDRTVRSHAFRFINTGTVTVYLNNFPLLPGASIGDDSSQVYAGLISKDPTAKFHRDDVFKVSFSFAATTGQQTESGQQQQSPDQRQSLYLWETYYNVVKIN